jgi:hypothetical protein
MPAHELYGREMLADLILHGLATMQAERMRARGPPIEVTRMRIVWLLQSLVARLLHCASARGAFHDD